MLTGVRVMIVEDEPLVALDLETTFKEAGASAFCARSIYHAIDLIQRGDVDFAVLDTLLWQGQTSIPISDMLRAAGIPFAVFSAHNTPHSCSIGHIMKPYTAGDVLHIAEAYLKVRDS